VRRVARAVWLEEVGVSVDRRAGAATMVRAIAGQVRALRGERGWSLDGLAGRSGVSKGMLVQVEGARTNPSIGTLCRIADAFGVAVNQLLAPGPDRAVRVVRADRSPLLWQGGYGGCGRLLASLGDPEPVEVRHWQLAPHDRVRCPDAPPGTRELLHVVAGALALHADGTTHQAVAGDSVHLAADRIREWSAPTEEGCRLLQVLVSPPSPVRGPRGVDLDAARDAGVLAVTPVPAPA
jgi:transcriptional regulator with XRE-family HTH domain